MPIIAQAYNVVEPAFDAVSETVFGVLFVALLVGTFLGINKLWRNISKQYEDREDKSLSYHEKREEKLCSQHKIREERLMEHLTTTTDKLSQISVSMNEINRSIQELNNCFERDRERRRTQMEEINNVKQSVNDIKGLLGRRAYDNAEMCFRPWEASPEKSKEKEGEKEGD